jgi:hypothetical protein
MIQCKTNGFEPPLFSTAFDTSATTPLFLSHMFLPPSVVTDFKFVGLVVGKHTTPLKIGCTTFNIRTSITG